MVLALASLSHAEPVSVAIIGLEHDHANGMIPRFEGRTDVVLAGIVETNPVLIERYSRQMHLSKDLFYPSIDALASARRVQAAALFTSTIGHGPAVEACARHGWDVMMEKPLAVDLPQARMMEATARRTGIRLVVNFETTWYPSVQQAYARLHPSSSLGEPRKFVVHDGHEGPKVIGCSAEFLEWLTDPVKNGGGATMDFGCYGADLVTWFMDGQRPTSVFSVAQHFQPERYPKVDDEGTIVITYPRCQAIIQASWNWPFDRKDMEIYCQNGSIMVPNRSTLVVRHGRAPEEREQAAPPPAPATDPLSYLAAIVRREIEPSGPSSLAVNLTAMEILDAARLSQQTGRRIDF